LEADALIRHESKGRRSLDDFCKLFYGAPSGAPQVKPYDFDALVAALNAVQPHDWAAFWRERLNRLRPTAPLEGLQAAGWHLAYTETPSSMHVAHEADDRDLDLRYSLGFYVDDEGASIGDVIPDSPADRAGVAPGSRLIALNGYKWSKELLHDTLSQPAGGAKTLTLLIEKDDMFKTLELNYAGGERYPNLIRDSAGEDLLTKIALPRTAERP
jgi:predicted metalloprotease with PDZ domain